MTAEVTMMTGLALTATALVLLAVLLLIAVIPSRRREMPSTRGHTHRQAPTAGAHAA
jgi:hypothetical protein